MIDTSLALKERLRRGELTIGAWITFYDLGVAEIMAGTGYDWLMIDMEHAPFTSESLTAILLALDHHKVASIVRVPWNDPVRIKLILDLGAAGVLVPQVATAQEAASAVAACKYPPLGIRGFGPRRASDYGRNMKQYVEKSNDATFVAIQIEHICGVEDIDAIVQVVGIDAILLGPMDLSGSMGLLGQLEHPEVVAAMDRVIHTSVAAGLPVGIPLPMDASLEVVKGWADKGCRFVVAGGDQGLLEEAARRSLANLRSSLGQPQPS